MSIGTVNPGLEALIDETRMLFHRLKLVAEEVHGQGKLSAGRRGVLRDLHRRGPQTVPQLARARPVSRQHIQSLVNDLEDDGYVELIDNPAHQRSRLVRLTAAGGKRLRVMEQLESKLIGELDIAISQTRLRAATKVLREVRGHFEGDRWRSAIQTNQTGVRAGRGTRRAG